MWYDNNHKTHIQTLDVPDFDSKFVLMTDLYGTGDRTWYCYQLPLESSITSQMEKGHDETGVLFWNYTEAGDHSRDAKLEVIKKKYLVFSRGGLYHSLYDMDKKQVLFNDQSPWHSFQREEESKKPGSSSLSAEERGKRMDEWVRHNIHDKIIELINADE